MDLSTFFSITATIAGVVAAYLTYVQMQLPFIKQPTRPKTFVGHDGYRYLVIFLTLGTSLSNVRYDKLTAKGFDIAKRPIRDHEFNSENTRELEFTDVIPLRFHTSPCELEHRFRVFVRLHKPAQEIEISIPYHWRWLHRTLRERIPVPPEE